MPGEMSKETKAGVTCHVYFKCFFLLFMIIEHNLGVLSRFVLNWFVVAEARVVLKMFLFWAKHRGSLFL